MFRYTRAAVPLAALLGLLATGPVLAQDAQTNINRAQHTLDEMAGLLDGILARSGGATAPSPAAMEENRNAGQGNNQQRGNRNGNRNRNGNGNRRRNRPNQPQQPK